MPDPRHELGQRGEALAARFLRRQGYRILANNLRIGRLEADLIAREGDTVAFVEVRTRASADPVPPEDFVGPAKQAHLRAFADAYISRYGEENCYYRFDVVAIVLPDRGKPVITLYRDAF